MAALAAELSSAPTGSPVRRYLGDDLRILTFSFEMVVCQAKRGAKLQPADFGRNLRPHAASKLLGLFASHEFLIPETPL